MLGIVNPIVTLIQDNGKILNFNIFLVYVIIMSIGLAVIGTTVMLMLGYADKIGSLEKEEQILHEKQAKLDALIINYNNLILSNTENIKKP